MTASVPTAVAHTSSWYWYFGRATGLIALVLLTATIVLGVLGPLRISSTVWPRFAIRTLHRDLALMSLLVIVIHVVAVVLDGYVHVPLSVAVLPVGSYEVRIENPGFAPFSQKNVVLQADTTVQVNAQLVGATSGRFEFQ